MAPVLVLYDSYFSCGIPCSLMQFNIIFITWNYIRFNYVVNFPSYRCTGNKHFQIISLKGSLHTGKFSLHAQTTFLCVVSYHAPNGFKTKEVFLPKENFPKCKRLYFKEFNIIDLTAYCTVIQQ